MSDRGNRSKDSTPPPLLLMPAGGGLTLNPPNQGNVLMPVIQSEPSLLDEDGEADSFVGQTPPPKSQSVSHTTPSVSSLFSNSGGASDPFSQVGHNPPPSQPGFASVPFSTCTASPLPPMQHTHTGPSHPAGPPGQGSRGRGQFPNQYPTGAHAPIPPGQGHFQGVPPSGPPGPTVPPQMSGALGASQNSNMFRREMGRPKYAQPPPGTYAPSGGGNVTQMSPFMDQMPPQPPPQMPHMPSPPVAQVPPTVPNFTPGPPGNDVLPSHINISQAPGLPGMYQPVYPHWCFCKRVENKDIWYMFSLIDSIKLEETFKSEQEGAVVPTDGGRYDVYIDQRLRKPVYWDADANAVKRCTWFYKREGDKRYVPYDEDFAVRLEDEYRNALINNTWHKRLEFLSGETIVMHNANVIVHFPSSSQPDEWGTSQEYDPFVMGMNPMVGEGMRPRVVKRGVEDMESIEDGEPIQVDHLVFVVHGIGSICDVNFRNIVECVDDFRSISLSLVKSHFKQHKDTGRIGRVEYIPVHWHTALHGDATGIDRRLKQITLPSTGKLRHFVNDTLMDILFYTSPVYCQCIADTVGSEMNRLYQLFLSRNPQFRGTVSVAGHSLGSSVLFDLLLHQKDGSMIDTPVPDPVMDNQEHKLDNSDAGSQISEDGSEDQTIELSLEDLLAKVGLQEKAHIFHQEQIDIEALSMCSEDDLKDLGLPMGPRKKLKGLLKEEKERKENRQLQAKRKAKEVEERKIREKIAAEMKQQQEETQMNGNARLSNSSVKMEFILGGAGTGQPFVKYPQLDFQPCALFAMGSPIGIFAASRGVENIGEDFRLPTCPRVYNIFHPFDPVAYRLEPLINSSACNIKPVLIPHHKGRKRLHLELKESLSRVGADIKQKIVDSLRSTWNSINQFAKAHRTDTPSLEDQVDTEISSVMQDLSPDDETSSIASSHDEDIHMGQLNEGRRIDYVLQERPIESFNDYIFALASHGCYWESEDTVLLVLKELYGPFGILPQMPGPENQNKAYLSGPPQMWPPKDQSLPPMSHSTVGGQQYIPAVPPMNQATSVPLVSPGQHMMPPQHNMTPPRPSGPNVGPPPLTGFARPNVH